MLLLSSSQRKRAFVVRLSPARLRRRRHWPPGAQVDARRAQAPHRQPRQTPAVPVALARARARACALPIPSRRASAAHARRPVCACARVRVRACTSARARAHHPLTVGAGVSRCAGPASHRSAGRSASSSMRPCVRVFLSLIFMTIFFYSFLSFPFPRGRGDYRPAAIPRVPDSRSDSTRSDSRSGARDALSPNAVPRAYAHAR